MRLLLAAFACLMLQHGFAQAKWERVDEQFQPLPASIQVYKTTSMLDGKPNIAYYVAADLKDKKLVFETDTTLNRRLTPSQYFEKNNQPYVVMNTTFFSFATHQNLNVVVKDGELVGYNIQTAAGKGKDTLQYFHYFPSAIGITKKRKADVAWVLTDSSNKKPYAIQEVVAVKKDAVAKKSIRQYRKEYRQQNRKFKKWKMQTATGGGPVLVQNGKVQVTNNEERRFAGKAIDDKHPRSAMGYTADGKLILMVVEGRNPGVAEGASLTQLATLLKDIGCKEALNLDGGGSSMMIVNNKETIKPSDKEGQRPVPGVFLIRKK